jgi:uncharacterized protein (DUF433 family)
VNSEDLLERINIDPNVMVGKPVIRGTRLTVEYILGLLAHGVTMDEILKEYLGLEKDDIYARLLFASKTLEDASFVPLKAATKKRVTLIIELVIIPYIQAQSP